MGKADSRPNTRSAHIADSTKAPQAQANSQRTTTAPSVKMPPVQLITDSKGPTAREKLVDAFNRENLAVSGGDQYLTYYERMKAEVAKDDKFTGSPRADGTLKGKPKQAQ